MGEGRRWGQIARTSGWRLVAVRMGEGTQWGQIARTSASIDDMLKTPSRSFMLILVFVRMAAFNCWALGTSFKAVKA
eukprot:1157199-Pelagomonas_calceolata.AAC.2